jgi:predicted AAA+ superfamily ATPase
MEPLRIYERTLRSRIEELASYFPCVMLTGARQVGKSTLLRGMLPAGMNYVTLDDYVEAARAKEDPNGFLDRHGLPLCIDEIQYAPELLRAIKIRVDENRRPGMYWLTGSQRFHMMKGVTESLAGRIGLLELMSLSQQELLGLGAGAPCFLPDSISPASALRGICGVAELYERIWRGGYPQLIQYPQMPVRDFFSSYLQTYVERDVQSLSQVGDKSAFVTLMRSAALRTGQQLVYSDLARDAGVSPKTAAAWISILEASGIVSLLQPYHSNALKRLAKSPKLYFLDTGLCSWLAGYQSAADLSRSPLAGAMLETWVYGQLLRSFTNVGIDPRLYYFRNHDGAEVDFLLEYNQCLYPMEVKLSSRPVPGDLKGMHHIPASLGGIHPGIVLCTATRIDTLNDAGMLSFPISGL